MRGIISRRGVVAAAALVGAPRLAQAAASFPDFPAPGPDRLIAFGGDDLAIAAFPLADPQDQKLYFGMDLNAAGVLPVWLSVANRSAGARFLLDADDIKLSYDQGAVQTAERSGSTVDDTGNTVALNVAAAGMGLGPVGLAVSLPVLLASGSQIARQDDVRRNLMVRQLYSRTLGPGQSVAGFVYCKVKARPLDLSRLRLSVGVKPTPAPPGAAARVFETALGPAVAASAISQATAPQVTAPQATAPQATAPQADALKAASTQP